MKKEIVEEFEWNKRRIAIGLIILTALVIGAVELKGYLSGTGKNVLGESAVPKSSEVKKPDVKAPDIQTEIGPKIEEIKKNIENLDANEIASSSPQIQKVLQDIQGIKDLPANQAKDACLKICGGL